MNADDFLRSCEACGKRPSQATWYPASQPPEVVVSPYGMLMSDLVLVLTEDGEKHLGHYRVFDYETYDLEDNDDGTEWVQYGSDHPVIDKPKWWTHWPEFTAASVRTEQPLVRDSSNNEFYREELGEAYADKYE